MRIADLVIGGGMLIIMNPAELEDIAWCPQRGCSRVEGHPGDCDYANGGDPSERYALTTRRPAPSATRREWQFG